MSYSYQKMEDLSENMRKFPLMNEYWEDKCAEFEKITCPAYVVASYTSTLHTHGTIEGYRRISSSEKWLRIHNTWEWPDLYGHEEDLRKFFDYYMKDKNNGWNKVPRVRMAVLDPGHTEHPPIVDRAEKSFPLERQQLVKLYLNAGNGTLVTTNPLNHCHVRYEGCPQNTCCQRNHYSAKFEEEINDPTEVSMVSFSYLFEKDTEITGYSKVKLWVEAETANDMDVYVRITKLDSNGRLMLHNSIMYNYPGPNGMLRASLRETNPEKSTPCEPYHPYKTVSYLSQGEIVPLEIGLWPTSMIFHAGETLRLCISGYDYLGRVGHSLRIVNFNKGGHIIHTGGEYDSYLILPIVH